MFPFHAILDEQEQFCLEFSLSAHHLYKRKVLLQDLKTHLSSQLRADYLHQRTTTGFSKRPGSKINNEPKQRKEKQAWLYNKQN